MRYEIYFGDETKIVLGPPIGFENFGPVVFTLEDLKDEDTAISFLVLTHSSDVSYSFVKIEIRENDVDDLISTLESILVMLFSKILKDPEEFSRKYAHLIKKVKRWSIKPNRTVFYVMINKMRSFLGEKYDEKLKKIQHFWTALLNIIEKSF